MRPARVSWPVGPKMRAILEKELPVQQQQGILDGSRKRPCGVFLQGAPLEVRLFRSSIRLRVGVKFQGGGTPVASCFRQRIRTVNDDRLIQPGSTL